MKGRRFLRLFLIFLVWAAAMNAYFIAQVAVKLCAGHIVLTIPVYRYLEYFCLNLVWINLIVIPIAGLFSSSQVFVSELLKKRKGTNGGKETTLSFRAFVRPAMMLGIVLSAASLVIAFFVVHKFNTRIAEMLVYFKTGRMVSTSYRSDREMGIQQLWQEAKKCAVEMKNNTAQEKAVTRAKLLQNKMLVEAYKKITFPIMAFLFPILGCILAIVFSRLRSIQVIVLLVSDALILAFTCCLLNLGEINGDRGSLPPVAAMSMAPALVFLIIAALSVPGYRIYESAYVCLKRDSIQ